MKLVRYLSEHKYNCVDMYMAIKTLSEIDGTTWTKPASADNSADTLNNRLSLLQSMRISSIWE